MWNGSHPRYERAEWEPNSGSVTQEDYPWAFYSPETSYEYKGERVRDHLVALSEAHKSGGALWPKRRKIEFANDRQNIYLAPARLNQDKFYYDPTGWRPEDRVVWQKYAIEWIRIKRKWGLHFDRNELEALREMLAGPGE